MCMNSVQFELDPFCSPSSFAPDGFSLLIDPAGLLQAASQLACSGQLGFGYKHLDTLTVIYFYTQSPLYRQETGAREAHATNEDGPQVLAKQNEM